MFEFLKKKIKIKIFSGGSSEIFFLQYKKNYEETIWLKNSYIQCVQEVLSICIYCNTMNILQNFSNTQYMNKVESSVHFAIIFLLRDFTSKDKKLSQNM